ncbi:hypothetical protein [Streptomyces sp. URMC 129]|uniref:hypothetical protein n=1 Tax=Streptomyces sp. URMC 129 TaxID=3423407 RepID=UPI003F1DF956
MTARRRWAERPGRGRRGRRPATGRAVAAAAGCAVLHGAALVLAVPVLTGLPVVEGAGGPAWPGALLAVAAGHAALSRYAAGRARAAGVDLARRLSYRVVARTLTMPPGLLTGDGPRRLARLATGDVVAVSGLAVHRLRPLGAALVVPPTAAAGCLALLLTGGPEPAAPAACLVFAVWCADAAHAALTALAGLRPALAAARRLRDFLFPG